jgi:PAS domain S-box-containing protein
MEEQYRQILEASMDAVSVTVGTKFVYANRRCVDLLGFDDPNQLVGRDFTEFIAPEDREMVKMRTLGREKGEPHPSQYEFKILRRDGTKVPVETHATVIEYEEKRAVLAIRRDITERKRMEEEIRSLAKFPLENPNPILRLSKEGVVLDANPASEALLRSWGGRIGGEAPKTWLDLVSNAFENQSPRSFDVELGDKVYLFTIVPVKDAGHVNVYGRDITDRKTTEKAAKQSEEKLKALHGHARTLAVANTIDEVARHTLDAMDFTLGFDVADFCIVEKDRIRVCGSRGIHVADALWGWPLDGLGVVVKSVQTKRTLRVPDTKREPSFVDRRAFSATEKLQLSELVVPVLLNGGVVAVLNVESSRLNAFTGEDQELLETLAMHVSSALGRLKQVEALEGLVEEKTRELRQSEERCRVIYDNAIDGIHLVGVEDKKFFDGNRAFCQMLGLSLEELKNTRVTDIHPKESLRYVIEHFEKVARKEITLAKDIPVKRTNGSLFYVDVSAAPTTLDGKNYLVGVFRDITERKQIEERLRESEERFRGIAERSFDMIVTLDPEGRINYASPAVILITGYAPEEMVGQHFHDYLPKEETPKEIQAFAEIAKGGIAKAVPLKIVRKDGSLAHVEINASPIISDGKITGVQAIVRDVSERYETEKLRGQFISAVTHELRTPLVSISGYLDLVLKNERFGKETFSWLEVVRRNTDRLLNLTNDILDLQRLQAGKLQVALTPVDFVDVLDNCIKEITPMIKGRRQVLKVDVPRVPIRIPGDFVRLTQVVMNLLDNASKFTPDGGRIVFRVEDRVDRVVVEVSDSGIGMRSEDVNRVFEPFANIKKPTYIKGTGLGLSVSKGLLEAHGGKISAESAGEGKGATFTFTLPKQKEAA